MEFLNGATKTLIPNTIYNVLFQLYIQVYTATSAFFLQPDKIVKHDKPLFCPGSVNIFLIKTIK